MSDFLAGAITGVLGLLAVGCGWLGFEHWRGNFQVIRVEDDHADER